MMQRTQQNREGKESKIVNEGKEGKASKKKVKTDNTIGWKMASRNRYNKGSCGWNFMRRFQLTNTLETLAQSWNVDC